MDLGDKLINKIVSNYSKIGASGTDSANEINKIKDNLKKGEMTEKWSEKYKRSIDCNNPKGFSQKAHCKGKNKKESNETTGSGSSGGYSAPLFSESLTEAERTLMAKLRDLAKKYAYDDSKDTTSKDKIEKVYQDLKKQYSIGLKVEKNHKSGDPKQIVIDHLSEDPKYYTKLKKVEATEATGSGSSGSYESPSFLAKSTSPKNWRGRAKTQIPGGKFVEVKKKCKTFPYCNQGDINALKLTESEVFDRITEKFSTKYNLPKEILKKIITEEIGKKK